MITLTIVSGEILHTQEKLYAALHSLRVTYVMLTYLRTGCKDMLSSRWVPDSVSYYHRKSDQVHSVDPFVRPKLRNPSPTFPIALGPMHPSREPISCSLDLSSSSKRCRSHTYDAAHFPPALGIILHEIPVYDGDGVFLLDCVPQHRVWRR